MSHLVLVLTIGIQLHRQSHGFTCGIDDLFLQDTAEVARAKILTDTLSAGRQVAKEFIGATNETSVDDAEIVERLSAKLREPGESENLDTKMMAKLNNYASDVIKHSLPWGQSKRFPKNCFSMVCCTASDVWCMRERERESVCVCV
jgi:hypothetical protein